MSEPKNAAPGSEPKDDGTGAKPPEQSTSLTKPTPTEVATPRPTAMTPFKTTMNPEQEAEELRTWSSKRAVLTGLFAVVMLVGGFGAWAVLSEIDGAIVAPGVIQVEQNRQVVQHPDGGVVAEINVTEAQVVKAGDLLIRLDGTQVKSELAIIEGQYFDSLARRARLEAERDDMPEPQFPVELTDLAKTRQDVEDQMEGQRRLFTARKETMAAQVSQLNKRMDQISSQVDGHQGASLCAKGSDRPHRTRGPRSAKAAGQGPDPIRAVDRPQA